jgi:hypothetical protein
MATITKREGKKGTTYYIRGYEGYDVNGKQIVRSMTWKPSLGMTPKQIEKALKEQAILFDQQIQNGLYLSGKFVFPNSHNDG